MRFTVFCCRAVWVRCAAIVPALGVLVAASFALAQSGPPPSIPIAPGVYSATISGDSSQTTERFTVRPDGRHFTVADERQTWTGEGEIFANSGHFAWKSATGPLRLGMAEFRVDSDGTWRGRRFGSGVNMTFVATPQHPVAAIAPPSMVTQAPPTPAPQVATARNTREQAVAAWQANRRLQSLPPDQREAAAARNLAGIAAGLPGLQGEVLRLEAAGRIAESEHRYADALQSYQQLDERRSAIISEARSLSASFVGQSTTGDPGRGAITVLARAQREGGVLLERGLVGRRDYAAAARLYEHALDTMRELQGVEMLAATRLGFLYAHGLGGRKDPARATELLKLQPGTVFAVMLAHHVLPRSLDDVTPAMVEEMHQRFPEINLTEREKRLLFALLLLGGGGGRTLDCTRWLGSNTWDCR